MKTFAFRKASKLLYGVINSLSFARLVGVQQWRVKAWRASGNAPLHLLPDIRRALHQIVEDTLPQPGCIERLNEIMGYERRAA